VNTYLNIVISLSPFFSAFFPFFMIITILFFLSFFILHTTENQFPCTRQDCALSRFVVATAATNLGNCSRTNVGIVPNFTPPKTPPKSLSQFFSWELGDFATTTAAAGGFGFPLIDVGGVVVVVPQLKTTVAASSPRVLVRLLSFLSSFFLRVCFLPLFSHSPPFLFCLFFFYFPPAKPKENGDAPVGKRKKMGERGLSLSFPL